MTRKGNIFAELNSLKLARQSDVWTLNRAIACALSDSELLKLYSSQKSKNIVLKSVLEKRDSKRLAAGQHKTIEKILDEFVERKRGYSNLRLALVRRFEFASKADKRRIIDALLTEYKQDRILAYTMLKSYWDSYFTDKLESLYKQYHDNECLIVFIKHYPKTFLKDKFDAIAKYYSYSYACYCMGPDYVEKIDKQKMHSVAWLQLMATFKQKVSEAEAEAILYCWVANCLDQALLYDGKGRFNDYSLLKISNVRDVIHYMGYLGMTDAILRFGKICKKAEALAEPFGHIKSEDVNAVRDYFNNIGKILPRIKVEDGYHNDVIEWVEKGQPVYDYTSENIWWYTFESSEYAQDEDGLKPIDDMPF